MALGFQEIIALLIVAIVVAIAIYRRWRRRRDGARAGCAECGDNSKNSDTEKPIRFYRRQD